MQKTWKPDFIEVLQAIGAGIITPKEARKVLGVENALRKAGK